MNLEKLTDLTLLSVYCAGIFVISAQPGVLKDMLFPHQDKLVHLLAYSIMGGLAWRYFRNFIRNKPLLAFVSIGFCSLYGFSDELHQSFVPGRTPDPYDWIADTFGASLSVFYLLYLKKENSTTR